jgi:hypothetical protein
MFFLSFGLVKNKYKYNMNSAVEYNFESAVCMLQLMMQSEAANAEICCVSLVQNQ